MKKYLSILTLGLLFFCAALPGETSHADRTTGSHACLYNSENYGSIYRNSMDEFFVLEK